MKTKNSKKYKKSVLLSVLLAIGLVGLLIGATYAWFSDSVSSKVNRIEAGNLDVSLKHKVGDSFEEVKEDTELFDITLWEPGAMAYESFEIANMGNLALRYEFIMRISEFNTVNETGKSLKDVLKIAIYNGEFNGTRDDLKSLNLDFSKNIYSFALRRELNEKEAKDKFTVVVYWEPSDADNEFNLNNGKTSDDGEPLHIELGVSLVATQNDYEEDSFGSDYDKPVVDVSSALDIYNRLKAGNDEIIRLTQDVTYRTASGLGIKKDAIIDLNGHTLTFEPLIQVSGGSDLVIKNGDLIFNGNGLVSSTSIVYENSSITLENINYISENSSGLYPSGDNAVINIKNCTFKTVGYAISTNASRPTRAPIINIKNSHFIASSEAGHVGTPILFNVNGQLNIEDSTIEGHYQGMLLRGGTTVIKNSTISNRVDSDEYIDKYKNINWESGTNAPVAGITMGNKSDSSYRYPTNVTLINTTIESLDGKYPAVYAYGNTEEGMGVTFNYDESNNVGNVIVGNDKVVINGENASVNE